MKQKILFTTVVSMMMMLAIIASSCKEDSNPVQAPGQPQQSQSLGDLQANPSATLASLNTQVLFRLSVPASLQLVDTVVQVERLGPTGQVTDTLVTLYDDGSLLSHGDDIIGDKVFSNFAQINETSPQDIQLRAVARVRVGAGTAVAMSGTNTFRVYSNLTSQEYATVISTQQGAATKFNTDLAGNIANLSSALDSVTAWLQTQPDVASASREGNTSISILYTSGIYGGLLITQTDVSGTELTRGGVISEKRRPRGRSIPAAEQTVGLTSSVPSGLHKSTAALDPTIIGNRNVLIYAPFESAFAPYNEGSSVQTILQNSEDDFNIIYLQNQGADIASLNTLTNYGFVLLATHGSQGKAFATGEVVDTNSVTYQTVYKTLLKAQKLAIWNNMTISSTGAVTIKANIYAIRYPFIQSLAGTFPNSVILNNSCESTKNPDLSNAFINKGAKSYIGYTKVVNSGYCVTNADTIAKRLAIDLKNTGESYDPGSDPVAPNAVIQLLGRNDLHYPDSLINGDFEYGNLDGWTKSGDGRVISQLSSLTPPGGSYMGIISTGLGFTTDAGGISQSFRIRPGQTTLTVKWNFLSEEFLEYIGSIYQDNFDIVIKTRAGGENILMHKTIDGLAAEYGATGTTAGSLIDVSPGIVFDQGDVYMTGLQTSTFNISSYANQRVTLILRAHDQGDSWYDTAILLDDITVY